MTVCKIKAKWTIEAQWQEKDIFLYRMDDVEVRPVITAFDVLPPLYENPNGTNLCVDLSDTLELTP